MDKKRRIVAIISITVALSLGAMQLLPSPAKINPPVNQKQSLQTGLDVPKNVQSILQRACMDCHSNETRWPWYSHVAPLSWGIVHDVTRARKAMNLSEWTVGAGRRPATAIGYLQAMCAGVKEGRMPPAKYVLLHRQSRLSPSDTAMLCEWTNAETERLIQTKRQATVTERAP